MATHFGVSTAPTKKSYNTIRDIGTDNDEVIDWTEVWQLKYSC